MSQLHRTTNHDAIRHWVDAHRGTPALLEGTKDALKVRFGHDEPRYDDIDWKKWFEIFDEGPFAFVYEEPGYTYKVVARKETDSAS